MMAWRPSSFNRITLAHYDRTPQSRIDLKTAYRVYGLARFGMVFINSSGLMEATTLPGWGILRM